MENTPGNNLLLDSMQVEHSDPNDVRIAIEHLRSGVMFAVGAITNPAAPKPNNGFGDGK